MEKSKQFISILFVLIDSAIPNESRCLNSLVYVFTQQSNLSESYKLNGTPWAIHLMMIAFVTSKLLQKWTLPKALVFIGVALCVKGDLRTGNFNIFSLSRHLQPQTDSRLKYGYSSETLWNSCSFRGSANTNWSWRKATAASYRQTWYIHSLTECWSTLNFFIIIQNQLYEKGSNLC